MENKLPINPAQSRKTILLSIVVIFLCGLMVYGNALNGQFVWDDDRLIEANSQIKNWGSFKDIFTSTLKTPLGKGSSYFRPLQTFTYLIDYSLWQLNPFGYHLTNIVFHVFSALALFWLIYLLFNNIHLSFIAALLFVVHPVHTGAVAYISGRADPMAACFMVLSFCLYLKNIQRSTKRGIALMILCYLASLLSRETALILLPLILFYHWTFKKPVSKKHFGGIVCAAVVYIFWRWSVFRGITMNPTLTTTLWQRTPGVFVALANYVRLLFVPFGLHVEYGEPLFSWNEPKIYVGVIILLSLIFLACKKRKEPLIFFSAGWFFVTVIPVLNIYPLKTYMAEHWLYLPSMGYVLMMAGSFISLYKTSKYRLWVIMLCCGLTAYYSGMTIYQNRFWRDPIRFYGRMIQLSPASTRLYTNLAHEMSKAGREDGLIDLLNRAIEIDPTNVVAYTNLGVAYKKMGLYDQAIKAYEKGIALNPKYAGTYYNMGVIYSDVKNDPDQAIKFLNQAVKNDPSFYWAYHKIGTIYWKQGKNDEALAMLNEALKINPGSAEIYLSLGFLNGSEGNFNESVKNYKKAIALNPRDGKGYSGLALVYFYQKQYKLAIQYCDKAVALGYTEPELLKALEAHR